MIRVTSIVTDYAHQDQNRVIKVMSNDNGDNKVIIRFGDKQDDFVEVDANDIRVAITNALSIMFDPRDPRAWRDRSSRYVEDEG